MSNCINEDILFILILCFTKLSIFPVKEAAAQEKKAQVQKALGKKT